MVVGFEAHPPRAGFCFDSGRGRAVSALMNSTKLTALLIVRNRQWIGQVWQRVPRVIPHPGERLDFKPAPSCRGTDAGGSETRPYRLVRLFLRSL
jgi:hypothetical protein